jgi:hypothetical protein
VLPLFLLALIDAPEGTERRVQPSAVSASSFRSAEGDAPSNNDHPWFAFDDDPKTAWSEGEAGIGPGPWIEASIPILADTTQVRLQLKNGNQSSKGNWKTSARAKEVKLTLLPSGVEATLTLKDVDGPQSIKLEQPSGPLTGVRLGIISGLAGTKDAQVVTISDVEIFATSKAAETSSFEKARFEKIGAWKRERALATKLWSGSGKNGMPVKGHYAIEAIAPAGAGAMPKGQREAAQAITEIAKRDPDQPRLGALEIASLSLRPDFAAWKRVEITLDPGALPMVDGLCTIELGANGCGGFEGPLLPRLALFTTPTIAIKAAKDQVTIDEALAATAPKCAQPDSGDAYAYAFEERVDDEEGNGQSKMRALLLVRCGVIASRAGHEAQSALQLLVYGDDGMLSTSVTSGSVITWLWDTDATTPRLAGARRYSFDRGIEALRE